MMAATRGTRIDAFGVIDFMPRDAMTWHKRRQIRSGGIKHPNIQIQILKQSFGFT
jgi:hypothetical protein